MFGPLFLLIVGIWAGATSVIFIKDSEVPPMLLSAYRLLGGGLLLSPLMLRDLRRHRTAFGRRHVRRAALPGVVLGLHFITWIEGARMTLAANASLIVNMVPVAMPFLMLAMIRERINRGEALGTLAAMAGVGLLAWSDYTFSPDHFRGDLICLGSMVLFALYLALGRRNRDFPTIWLYVVPVYLIGGAFCFLVGLAFHHPAAGDYPRDLWMILGLAVVPTIIGHSTLNWCMKHMRGQVVGIATLGQFIFAGVMAYFYPPLREAPTWTFYPASVLVVAGAVVALRATPPTRVEADAEGLAESG
jgi:drug/metabolite transporter (DMT)-like permease